MEKNKKIELINEALKGLDAVSDWKGNLEMDKIMCLVSPAQILLKHFKKGVETTNNLNKEEADFVVEKLKRCCVGCKESYDGCFGVCIDFRVSSSAITKLKRTKQGE